MKIRAAGPGDIPAIVAIGHATWPQTYAFAGADYIAHGLATWWSPEAVARSLQTTTVLIAEDGRAKLADLGVAKLLADGQDLTSFDSGIGTP